MPISPQHCCHEDTMGARPAQYWAYRELGGCQRPFLPFTRLGRNRVQSKPKADRDQKWPGKSGRGIIQASNGAMWGRIYPVRHRGLSDAWALFRSFNSAEESSVTLLTLEKRHYKEKTLEPWGFRGLKSPRIGCFLRRSHSNSVHFLPALFFQ